MVMKRILLLMLFVLSGLVSRAQDKTKIGVYVTSVSDLNYVDNSFSAEIWIWRLNTNKDIHHQQLIEFMNAKSFIQSNSSVEVRPGKLGADSVYWEYKKVNGIFRHVYDIQNFPFDEELLEIDIEDAIYSNKLVAFDLDLKESGLASGIKFQNWEIDSIKFEYYTHKYNSSFGDPNDTDHYSYPGLRVLIPIKRDSFFLFTKLFTGLFVAFVIALFSLKIDITEADARFGACVGGLFAGIANMYIVNSNLPMVSQITLIDQLHVLTFFCVVALFIVSTVSLKYYSKGQIDKSIRLDRITFNTIAIFYVLSIAGMLILFV
jgi:hypothetical protein